MPVNSEHRQFNAWRVRWAKCRNTVAGSDAIKLAGTKYLPMLSGQSQQSYNAYKERALFFGATSRTVAGLVGMIFRKDPNITGNNDRELLETTVSKDGKTLMEFLRETTKEVIEVGRVGVLIDAQADGEGQAYFAEYPTEAIINWRTYMKDGLLKLSLVVLMEEYEIPTQDKFKTELKMQFRELLLENGIYKVNIWRKVGTSEENASQWAVINSFYPTVGGRYLDYIPFHFITPSGSNMGAIEKPPILDIAEVNLSHYRSSADLEHGRHFTGLPTAYVAGFDPKTTELKIGSETAWVSSDPNAKAAFLEFTGQGLGTLKDALAEKNRMMTILGARLLEETNPKAAEATETHRLRKSGENNIVATIAKSISGATTQLLEWLSDWRTDIRSGYTIELNTDYVQTKLKSDEIVAMVGAWQNGAISDENLVWNFQQGEILPDTIEKEDEVKKLEAAKKKKEDAITAILDTKRSNTDAD